jgi:hypothetical protein
VNGTANTEGDSKAVPPILRPARPSKLAELRREEAHKRRELHHDPAAIAPYSDAELNAFATEGHGGS